MTVPYAQYAGSRENIASDGFVDGQEIAICSCRYRTCLGLLTKADRLEVYDDCVPNDYQIIPTPRDRDARCDEFPTVDSASYQRLMPGSFVLLRHCSNR